MRDRDSLIYSFIVNRLKEKKIIFLAKSIENESFFKEEVDRYQNNENVRLNLQLFGLEITESKENNLVTVKGIVNLDPKFYKIPDSFITTLCRKVSKSLK